MVEQAAHHGPQNENKILQLTAVTTLIMKKKNEIDFFFNSLFFVKKKSAYNNIIIHIGHKQYYTFICMNELRMEIHVWITCLSSQQMNR